MTSGELPGTGEEDGKMSVGPQNRAIENWLRCAVGGAYDALMGDPSRALSSDQVRERLAAELRNVQ